MVLEASDLHRPAHPAQPGRVQPGPRRGRTGRPERVGLFRGPEERRPPSPQRDAGQRDEDHHHGRCDTPGERHPLQDARRGDARTALEPVEQALHAERQPGGEPDAEEEADGTGQPGGHAGGEAPERRRDVVRLVPRGAREPEDGEEQQQRDDRSPDAHRGGDVLDAGHGVLAPGELARAGDRRHRDRQRGRERGGQPEQVEERRHQLAGRVPRPGLARLRDAVPPAAHAPAAAGDRRRPLRVAEEEDDEDRHAQPDHRRPAAEVGQHLPRVGDRGDADQGDQEERRRAVQVPQRRAVGVTVEEGVVAEAREAPGLRRRPVPTATCPRLAQEAQPVDRADRDEEGEPHHETVVAREIHPGQPLPGHEVDQDDADADGEQRREHQRQEAQHRAAGRVEEPGSAPVRRGQHELGGVGHAERDQQDPQRLGPGARGPPAPVERLDDVAVVGPDLVALCVGRPEGATSVVAGHLAHVRAGEHGLRRRAADTVDA